MAGSISARPRTPRKQVVTDDRARRDFRALRLSFHAKTLRQNITRYVAPTRSPAPHARAPARSTVVGACLRLGAALRRAPDRLVRAALPRQGPHARQAAAHPERHAHRMRLPVEVIVVDCGSRDGTDSLMSSWGELPGFRRLTLDGRRGSKPPSRPASRGARRRGDPARPGAAAHARADPRCLQWSRTRPGLRHARSLRRQRAAPLGRGADRRRHRPARPCSCRPSAWALLLDRRLVDWLVQAG